MEIEEEQLLTMREAAIESANSGLAFRSINGLSVLVTKQGVKCSYNDGRTWEEDNALIYFILSEPEDVEPSWEMFRSSEERIRS